MTDFETDSLIVGAGVVGLACAAALARAGREVIVLEREASFGRGVSSRNSEVIHAGLYYPENSLKHRFCLEGRRRLYMFCQARGVAHARLGKLVVATSAHDLNEISALLETAQAKDVEGLSLLDQTQAAELEPQLSCHGALLSAETGIVDAQGLMRALVGEIEDHGGQIARLTPVTRLTHRANGGFEVETGGEAPTRIGCRQLVNAAGLQANALARDLVGDKAPPLFLAKGSYFACAGRSPFSRLIYPVPVPGGLGVHLTLDLGGQMRFGPDVEWLSNPDPEAVDYRVAPARADSFYAAIRRYWPALPDDALTPAYSGCRPKLSAPGEAAADFRIDGPDVHGLEGLVQLFGMESPGLTASLAVGDYVAGLLS